MTRGVENTLLAHGGTEDIDIPYPARQRIVEDALKPDCDDMISQLRLQNEALEEANKRVCEERDFYMGQCHAYEARQALLNEGQHHDKLLAALTEIADLDILKYHHASAIAKGAIEEIEALKC